MPAPDDARRPLPSRRNLLALAMSVGLAPSLLTGCEGTARPAAVVSDPAVTRTADRTQRLLQAAQAAAGSAATAERARFARLVADHQTHLAALGVLSASPAPSPKPSATAAQLARAEREGAEQALGDSGLVAPAVAVLLTRIAASRAVHADLLDPRLGTAALVVPSAPATASSAAAGNTPTASGSTPTPTPGSPDAAARDALAALVAGEHAAVFGYGLVVARTGGADRRRAQAAWQWHELRRDAYADVLHDAGGVVPAARPAYDVGDAAPASAGPAAGRALATRIERALFTTVLDAVAQSSGPWRSTLARDAAEAARRLEHWAGPVPALP